MRWVVCVALLLALVPRAFAGDYDILLGAQPVGPATFTRWSGFYAGGQYGWSDANADFSNATSGPVAFALRVTTLESQDSPSTGRCSGPQITVRRPLEHSPATTLNGRI